MVGIILILMNKEVFSVSITNIYSVTHRIPKMTPKAQNTIRTYNHTEKKCSAVSFL